MAVMVRKLVITVFALHCIVALSAGNKAGKRDWPLVTFGIEADYAGTFFNFAHFNYISEDAYRIDIKEVSSEYVSNGQIIMNVGVNVSGNVNLSLNCGYMGLYSRTRLVPVTVRASWLFGDKPLENRWLAFLDVGCGISKLRITDDIAGLLKLGCGYRISLNRSVKLDFLCGLQGAYYQPKVYETQGSLEVRGGDLRRNDSYNSSIFIGIGLVF